MHILCDTSSVLMLIRIAPDMFTDARFQCVTIPDVKKEIFSSVKFKDKFSWRNEYKRNIKVVSALDLGKEEFKENSLLIKNILNEGIVNNKGRLIDLSWTDRAVAAYAVTNQLDLTTCDYNLAFFVENEFELKNFYPLELLNEWIKKELVEVTDKVFSIIEDWIALDEPVQPAKAIEEFERLTGSSYPQ